MATGNDVSKMTETIYNETKVTLADSINERFRLLGDSAFKAGIKAVAEYLISKSQLSEKDLQKLSAAKLPEDYSQKKFEEHLANSGQQLSKTEQDLCNEAFNSGIPAALSYLLKNAKAYELDLLSLTQIPS